MIIRDQIDLRLAAAKLAQEAGGPSAGQIIQLVAEAWQGGRAEAGRDVRAEIDGLLADFRDDLVSLGPLLGKLADLVAGMEPQEIVRELPGPGPRPGSAEEQIARSGEILRARIWDYLDTHGPATAAQIAAATGDPETVIDVQCRDAAGRGMLSRGPGDDYSIPVLPLSDEGVAAEAQADAARRLAGFGWQETGIVPPDQDGVL